MASENTITISADVARDKKLLIKQAVEKVRTFLVALPAEADLSASSAKPSMSHWSTLMKTGHITIRTSSQATPLRQMTSRSMGTQHCTVARRYISNPQVIPRTFHLVGNAHWRRPNICAGF